MNVHVLHSAAMDLAEKAMIERARGDRKAARKSLKEAFEQEERAAWLAVSNGAPEPTRSILLKSAAHLAIDADELRRAERLIGAALAGDPPEEIAQELRVLFEDVGFHRHLERHGVELQNNDVQLVLVGRAISPGMADSHEFVDRVSTMQHLLNRTCESDQGMEYRDRGDPKTALKLFVSVPRAASFAVSLRVANERDQGEFEFAESSEVLNRLLDRLEMFDHEEFDALRRAIPGQQYFDKFIELASRFAPDGERVRLVGLTTVRGQTERRLQLKRPAGRDEKGAVFVPSHEPRKFHGRVFFINTKDEENPVIKLMTDDDSEFRLKAEDDLLQQAVKCAASGTRVTVTGVQTSKTVLHVDALKPVRRRKTSKKRARTRRR